MIDKLADVWKVLRSDGGLRALAAGKPRSIASFRLAQSLQDEGTPFATIVDGGANVGQFARAARRAFPESTIFSFEPLPEVAARLRRNLAEVPGHQIFEMALGSEDGEIEFHRCSDSQSSSVLQQRKYKGSLLEGTREVGTLRLPGGRLDSVLRDVAWEPPLLLKLDLQGYELAALKGAPETLAGASHVLVETAFEEVYVGEPHFEEIWLHLRERGFRFLRPLAFLRNSGGRIVQMDALFRNCS